MNKLRPHLAAVGLLSVILCGCTEKEKPGPPPITPPHPASMETPVKIGYVLHGLNDFTQVIKRGAEDAGKALNADVEVAGPAGFVATDAIAMFEGMVQKKKDGLAVIPMPGALWVRPIKTAVDAKFPVVTANITSPGSEAEAWFGQDEYRSGVTLARELRKILEADGKTSGKILVGLCKPGEDVLDKRYQGFKKGMEGTKYTITAPFDAKTENTENYGEWENHVSANKDIVAAVGLCSMDIPNMAKVKKRAGGKWAVAGYDLNIETLDAIKAGLAQLTLGQHPYLQGYLPVKALVEHLRDKKPLVKGWVDVGTEVVTKANVDSVYERESVRSSETKWYADDIATRFPDLSAAAKPMPGK